MWQNTNPRYTCHKDIQPCDRSCKWTIQINLTKYEILVAETPILVAWSPRRFKLFVLSELLVSSLRWSRRTCRRDRQSLRVTRTTKLTPWNWFFGPLDTNRVCNVPTRPSHHLVHLFIKSTEPIISIVSPCIYVTYIYTLLIIYKKSVDTCS